MVFALINQPLTTSTRKYPTFLTHLESGTSPLLFSKSSYVSISLSPPVIPIPNSHARTDLTSNGIAHQVPYMVVSLSTTVFEQEAQLAFSDVINRQYSSLNEQ